VVLRFFVMANTAPLYAPAYSQGGTFDLPVRERIMSFNYLTNSSGFTRITAYVGQLLDSAVDGHIEELSQKLGPDPASRGLNRAYDLGELMSRTIAP
jgi:hypothetical protein